MEKPIYESLTFWGVVLGVLSTLFLAWQGTIDGAQAMTYISGFLTAFGIRRAL
jgi:hypothetical protein